ncbi:hypothetical protein [Salarchaeum japonicum]|uniref:Uncharacterized protein n=1 Tax=Salarchaeum japonicum TaxID=555573 RepID=A0AAV3SZF7_9EURY|nr:hypothetical protein [Salarchaeum japonicum]
MPSTPSDPPDSSDAPDTITVEVPRRGAFYLLVALVLLANPLYTNGLLLGADHAYQYEAHRVEPTDDSLVVHSLADDDTEDRFPLDGVLCADVPYDRACTLEHAIGAGEVNVTVPYEMLATPAENPYFLGGDGQFYRRTGVPVEGEDAYRVGHERVPAAAALRALSMPAGDAGPTVQRVLADGSVTTFHELDDAGRVLRDDGDYYVVFATAHRYSSGGFTSCGSEGDGFCERVENTMLVRSIPTLLGWLGAVVCLVLARRAWRT